MICIILGFRIESDISEQLLKIPESDREGLVTGLTDYDDEFVGLVVMDMGPFGIGPVYAPVDLSLLTTRITKLGIWLERDDMMIAEITTEDILP